MKMTETGKLVYERTYSRTKPDGTKETWPETVQRVVDGNLALVDSKYQLEGERDNLIEMITNLEIIPAGRHLWATGAKGRQYLFNCHVSHWGDKPSDHFEFTFLRLMEGGGVGTNYSNRYLSHYPLVQHPHSVEIVCDPEHPDYEDLKAAGVLSTRYDSEWSGAFPVEDSREGWAAALVDLIDTYYRPDVEHYHRVYDVSRVRGKGSRLRTFGGYASGPVPFAKMMIRTSDVLAASVGFNLTGMDAMEIDHAIAECVVSGGNRRSARMSIMDWGDWQIEAFLTSKEFGAHWTTNISVEVDDWFWDLVDIDEDNPQTAQARWVLEEIAAGMLHNGEPGFWDSTLSNVGEPNEVVCTNPCGEIALMPWENCNLGHVNLAAFVDENGHVDFSRIILAHRLMTRFLIRATYGDVNDPKQAEILARNRRIGVGHLGVASYLAMLGVAYSEAPACWAFHGQLENWAAAVDLAATQYAHDLRIPVPVKTRTVAPTGTIAKLAGVSEGIHPIFAKFFTRRIRFSTVDPDQVAQLKQFEADGYHVEPCQYAENTMVVEIPTRDILVDQVAAIHGEEKALELVESADELNLGEMLEFQALYQRNWADNAVSFTANLDGGNYTVEEIADTLKDYGGRLKGATVFPEASMPQAPYERITKEQFEAATAKTIADGVDEECASGACPIR